MKEAKTPEVEINSRRLITKKVEFNNLHATLQEKLSMENYENFKNMIQNLFKLKSGLWTFSS